MWSSHTVFHGAATGLTVGVVATLCATAEATGAPIATSARLCTSCRRVILPFSKSLNSRAITDSMDGASRVNVETAVAGALRRTPIICTTEDYPALEGVRQGVSFRSGRVDEHVATGRPAE